MDYDVIVIGGGPGGYAAALYCVRDGLRTLVLEKTIPGGQMATTPLIENYPGIQEIDGVTLAQNMRQGAERFGAATIFSQVTALDLQSDPKVVTTDSGSFTGGTILLAMGAQPRSLDLPGAKELQGRGISYCAACDGMFFRGKTVAVFGGGNSAVSGALTLSRLCKQVHLIYRRDVLRAEHSYQQALKQADNVIFHPQTLIQALHGTDHLTGLTLLDRADGQTRDLDCAGLFVAIGRVSETGLVAGQLELDDQGYVVADETTRTNVPGVFAVGDLRAKPVRQIVTAAADGATASHFAAAYLAQRKTATGDAASKA